MIIVLGIVLGLYSLILALVTPWPVAAWGVVGLVIGGIAGNSGGLAYGGDAINAAGPMALVGFVIGATIALVYRLVTTVHDLKTGSGSGEPTPPTLWDILLSLQDTVFGDWRTPADPPDDCGRRTDYGQEDSPEPPPARPVRRSVQQQYDPPGKELRPARELELNIDREREQNPDSDEVKLFKTLGLILVVALGTIVYFWWLTYEPESGRGQAMQTTTESVPQDTEPPSAADTESDDGAGALDYRDVRRWMPQFRVSALNPNAPEYSPTFVRRVENARDRHMAAGHSEADAVTKAIHDLTELEEPATAPAAEPSQDTATEPDRDAGGGCELKNVMTDEDYRACGITPPSTH